MGWRFRKSFSPFPGIRFNLSPSGISASIGAGPARLSIGPGGAAVTTRIPGTGISFRQPIDAPSAGRRSSARDGGAPLPPSPRPLPPSVPSQATDAREIRSASTASLTSEGLSSFKELLAQAQGERASVIQDLQSAKRQSQAAISAYDSWNTGWLMKRIFQARFAERARAAVELREKVAELEEQERLAKLQTEFHMPGELREAYGRLADATARLGQSQRIWDATSTAATDRFRERTLASETVNRERATVSLGTTPLIETSFKVPHFTNANGGDVLIYPGFALYLVSKDAFAVVDAREIEITYEPSTFLEEEGVPSDAVVVGHAWKKSNKDGSPDKRFANNYQIPIVRYGRLRLKSGTGLNEEYLISNAEHAEGFANEWARFRAQLPAWIAG